MFLFISTFMDELTTRPTPINKTTYIKFGNKCRTNNKEISKVLENLCILYLKKGDIVFEGLE